MFIMHLDHMVDNFGSYADKNVALNTIFSKKIMFEIKFKSSSPYLKFIHKLGML